MAGGGSSQGGRPVPQTVQNSLEKETKLKRNISEVSDVEEDEKRYKTIQTEEVGEIKFKGKF